MKHSTKIPYRKQFVTTRIVITRTWSQTNSTTENGVWDCVQISFSMNCVWELVKRPLHHCLIDSASKIVWRTVLKDITDVVYILCRSIVDIPRSNLLKDKRTSRSHLKKNQRSIDWLTCWDQRLPTRCLFFIPWQLWTSWRSQRNVDAWRSLDISNNIGSARRFKYFDDTWDTAMSHVSNAPSISLGS